MDDEDVVGRLVRRPIVILVGHAGSGKSEVAVNLALGLEARGGEPVLVDLDLVKPYFRSRLVQEELSASGVEVVLPEGDRLYADTPIVPPEVRRHLAMASELRPLVIDVGGNDNGARVLGSLSAVIAPEETDVLFVVNANRPLTGGTEAMAEIVAGMGRAAGLEVTGLVSNTHLMDETTKEMVLSGLQTTRALSERTGLSIRFCCIPEFLSSSSTTNEEAGEDCPVLVLKRHILPPHSRHTGPGRARVL